MGCINSTKKLNDFKNDNVFRVRVVRLQPESPTIRCGILELNPRELIFDQGRQPVVVWALQHLRRYGLNGDVFSFEAGRRCMTGPGIYMFRCQQAERLYQLFQRYVNAVSLVTDDAFIYPDREHPSHTLGRPDPHPHSNNYLEPAPMRNVLRESFSSSPLSLELDSPDSVPSLSFTNEVVHFQNHPSTPGSYINTNVSSNVYLEHPLRTHSEHNNNTAIANGPSGSASVSASGTGCAGVGAGGSAGGGGGGGVGCGGGGGGSAFSTLSRKMIAKGSSLDVPPDDLPPSAPLLTGSLHMYANVEGLGSASLLEDVTESSERCYENLSTCPRERAVVNYIVLDLDQPRSPAQCSPKTCFGSGLSLVAERQDSVSGSADLPALATVAETATTAAATSTPTNTATTTTASPTTTTTTTTTTKPDEPATSQQHSSESSLGYSTIDFIKTCALIKSSTHGADFDFDPDHDQDQKESRITRHSKCVRKAYSISE